MRRRNLFDDGIVRRVKQKSVFSAADTDYGLAELLDDNLSLNHEDLMRGKTNF